LFIDKVQGAIDVLDSVLDPVHAQSGDLIDGISSADCARWHCPPFGANWLLASGTGGFCKLHQCGERQAKRLGDAVGRGNAQVALTSLD